MSYVYLAAYFVVTYLMPIDNIHDKFFKESFSRKDITTALLQHVLPPDLVERLDLPALELVNGSYVDEDLQEHFADLLFSCPYQGNTTVQIALLLEHKSYREKYPHWQLLRYLLNGWEDDRKQKRSPMIRIPVIIYHGKGRWQYKPMTDYFPAIDPPLPQYIPDFQYQLVDLSVLPDERIASFKSRFLETVLLLMKYRQDEQFLLTNGARLFYWLEDYIETSEGENFLRTTLVYLACVTDISKHELVEQLFVKTPLVTKAMTVLDYWIETGVAKGIQEGRSQAIIGVIKNAYNASKGQIDINFLTQLTGYNRQQVEEIIEKIKQEKA